MIISIFIWSLTLIIFVCVITFYGDLIEDNDPLIKFFISLALFFMIFWSTIYLERSAIIKELITSNKIKYSINPKTGDKYLSTSDTALFKLIKRIDQ